MKKAVKAKVGRPKCTICPRSDVESINKQIIASVSLRAISRSLVQNDSLRSSLKRHIEDCLKFELSELVKGRKIENAINVHDEFRDNLSFARELRLAAREYLSDPNDPLRLAIIPRADEIDVVYFESATKSDVEVGGDKLNKSGTRLNKPEKKTAKLSLLLESVEELRNIEVDKVNIKHVDLRSFALDAIKTTDICIDKFAKLAGDYSKDKENSTTIDEVANSVVTRLISKGWPEDEARALAAAEYPEVSQAVN